MELIPASNGNVPHDRRPVIGGSEIVRDGNGRERRELLYHGIATVDGGVRVPGKVGAHLVSWFVCLGLVGVGFGMLKVFIYLFADAFFPHLLEWM
jgi:hypothetical protein